MSTTNQNGQARKGVRQQDKEGRGEDGLQVIGIVHSPFSEKFGIPRQPGLVRSARAQLELLPPFNREELVRGLDNYSHIWVLFLFHQAVTQGWKDTVRPPRLGGRKRVGVFASRSPHRPNHLGISAVRLERIQCRKGEVILEISGVDLLDGTPVVDIKPYLPYSDVVTAAVGELACGAGQADKVLSVQFDREAEDFCRNYQRERGRDLYSLITESLSQDPRPAIQRKKGKDFGMLVWDVNVSFRVDGRTVEVLGCTLINTGRNR